MREKFGGGLSELRFLFSLNLPSPWIVLLPGNPALNLYECLLGRLKGKKIILLVDSAYYFQSVNYSKGIEKYVYLYLRKLSVKLCNKVIFSYEGARFHTSKGSIVLNTFTKRTVYFIRNRERLVPLSERYYDYAFVGRFELEKGVLRIIDVAKKYPEKRFVLAGAGTLERELLEGIADLGNVDVTFFNGEIDAYNFFNSVKCLLILSLQEGCSLASKEALSMGCCICSVKLVGSGPLEMASKLGKGYLLDERYTLPEQLNDDLKYIIELEKIFDKERFTNLLLSFCVKENLA